MRNRNLVLGFSSLVLAAIPVSADTIQSLPIVNAIPTVKLIENQGLQLAYTNVNAALHTGELKITGTEMLTNGGLPGGPAVFIPAAVFTLDVVINSSNPGAYNVTGGTLSITNGGNDITAAIAPGANFGYQFITGGGALYFFDFVQGAIPSSLQSTYGIPIVNGTGLGVTIDISSDKNYLPTLASFASAGGLDYAGTRAKADIVVTTPLPTAAWGATGLLLALGASKGIARRRLGL